MKKKVLFSILFFSLTTILISYALGAIFEYFDVFEKDFNGPKFNNLTQELFIAIIFAPLIETFVFQSVIYYLVKLFDSFLKKYFVSVYLIISSLLFALSHSYSIYYEIATFFIGLIFAYSFLYFKKESNYPILCVAIIHSLYNAFVTLMDYI
ncbi:CPBP family intramembrane glutamic endopeptidase [Elizabethkingia anophelis]|uniref:CPBP family intramembrane glutamic endopeptidase n=1 Tax=Elizabethkingia anophelis TaxID=1117645 RepID=UPI00320AF9F7